MGFIWGGGLRERGWRIRGGGVFFGVGLFSFFGAGGEPAIHTPYLNFFPKTFFF